MFAGKSQVFFTQSEAKTLVRYLIAAIHYAFSGGYVKRLSLIFYLFVVQKKTLSRSDYDRTKEVFDRTNQSFPNFKHASGLYYRALHDSKFSHSDRVSARDKWNSMIDFEAARSIEREWNTETISMLDKMRAASVPPEVIAGIVQWMNRNQIQFLPEEMVTIPGHLRVVA